MKESARALRECGCIRDTGASLPACELDPNPASPPPYNSVYVTGAGQPHYGKLINAHYKHMEKVILLKKYDDLLKHHLIIHIHTTLKY